MDRIQKVKRQLQKNGFHTKKGNPFIVEKNGKEWNVEVVTELKRTKADVQAKVLRMKIDLRKFGGEGIQYHYLITYITPFRSSKYPSHIFI